MTRSKFNFTESQQKIVDHFQGNAVVLAVAGAGKTTVMTHRAANLVNYGIPQPRILMVTFTNKAAEAMKNKLVSLGCPAIEVRTLHAFCYQLLREFRPAYRNGANLLTEKEDWRRSGWAKDAAKRAKLTSLKAHEALALIESCKTAGLHPTLVDRCPAIQNTLNDKAVNLYRVWTGDRLQGDRFDYNDLVLEAMHLLRTDKTARDTVRARLSYVMVDEYQDTDPSQEMMLEYLCGCKNSTLKDSPAGGPSLMVIGDDDQSIYGFRHAKPDLILNFPDKWGAETYFMEENFRSGSAILNAANSLIKENTVRYDKKLLPTKSSEGSVEIMQTPAEGDYVAKRIKIMEKTGVELPEIAILFRTNAQSCAIESALTEEGVPYICDGSQREGFYGITEVKTILSYLRVIYDEEDLNAFQFALNRPNRFIKKEYIADCSSGCSTVYELIDKISFKHSGVSGRLTQLKNILTSQPVKTLTKPVKLIDFLIQALGIKEWINTVAEDSTRTVDEMRDCVDQMRRDAARKGTLKQYLDHVDRVIENAKKPKSKNAVKLLTLHRAKGLEFDVVFFTGFSNKYVPHPKGDEPEERRLAFVGLTRAKKQLILTAKEDLSIFSTYVKPPEEVK
jgi:DNA helicase-2/ATP-dependent DNA helicase PcrA